VQEQGPVNLGSAYGDLLIDTSKLESSLNQAFSKVERQAGSMLSRVGSSVQSAGDSVSGLGVSITKMTAPIAAFGAASLKVFGSFDDAMAEIAARTGATAEEMDKVKAKALEMGKTTSFSATQSAEGMLQLLASGYDLNETFAALPSTLDAAAAGGMDLGYTADVLTDALAMFNLGAEDADRVADALARGAAASSAEINDLAQGLGNVGPVAAQFGLSIEDTVAILAAFSERGIKGAEAGTQLRSMLNSLSKPSDKVRDQLKALGVEIYDMQGNVRPLHTVFSELRTAMAGLSEQERIEALKVLGGAYGQLGLSVLTSSDAMGDMTTLMGEQADAATVADARMNSLNGKIRRVSSSIQTMMIETVGPAIDKYLKPFLDRVAELITNLTLWAQANPELTEKIVLFGAALVALGPTLFAVGKAIKLVGKAIKLVGVAIGLLSSPIALAIGAAVALYTAYKKNFLGLRDFLQPIIETLSGGFKQLYLVINTLVGIASKHGIGQALNSLFGGTMIQSLLESFGMGPGMAETLASGIRTVFKTITDAIDELVPRLRSIWDAIRAGDLSGVLSQVAGLAGDIVREIGNQLPAIVAKLGEWGQAFLDWVGPKIKPLLKELGDLAVDVLEWIGEQVTALGEKLLEWGGAFIDWVGPATTDLLSKLPGLVQDVLDWIGEKVVELDTKLLEWATAFVEWLGPATRDVLPKLGTFVGEIIGWILGTGAPRLAIGAALFMWELILWVKDAVVNILPELWNFIVTVGDYIVTDLVPALASFAWNLGRGIITGVIDGLKGLGQQIWNTIKNELPSMDDVRNFITGGLDTYAPRTGSAQSQGGAGYLWRTDPWGSPQFFQSAGGTWRMGQYQMGGYTGDGPNSLLAGLVHRGEYVIPAKGVPVLRESGSTPPITVQITESVMERHPNAEQYGRDLARGLQTQLRHAGGGVVSG